MRVVYLVILFLSAFSQVHNWKIFHKGRQTGGNLRLSSDTNNKQPGKYEQWFTQNLDHFDPVDQTTWKQRYYVNDEFFDRNNSLVFLMIGGEGEATDKWMTQGAWIEYAKELKALCFQLEHRYYGKSMPKEDLSTKNLVYLTSQQALADLANFIENMNIQYELPSYTKWIAFGGSYPGSLAAWLRVKYPHLIHGAMSASGPLLAQLDFQEYFHVVEQDLRSFSDTCMEAVLKGNQQIDSLLQESPGQDKINTLFKLCDPITEGTTNDKDIPNLFETLSGNFANIAQYNKDNRIGNNAQKNITIDTLCTIMTNENIGEPIDRLAAVNDLILQTFDQKCVDYKYDKMIDSMRNISLEAETAEGGRQWTYQTCTEFGFFQSSTHEPQVFGNKFPIDFFIDMCMDIFGARYNRTFLENAIQRTNIIYGALDIEVSNVVFVHGSFDPWHALGVTKTIHEEAPAIYIEGTAHCANMYPSIESDLPALKAARATILELIKKWTDL